MSVLEIEKLCKRYEKFALQDVSFKVAEGHIVGFMGRNGARYILKVISTTSAPISTGIRA